MPTPMKQTTVLSTKGQVILPKAIRDRLNWRPGAKLVVEETGMGVAIRLESPYPPSRLEDVIGILKYDGPPISIEEMNEGLLDAVAEDFLRSVRED